MFWRNILYTYCITCSSLKQFLRHTVCTFLIQWEKEREGEGVFRKHVTCYDYLAYPWNKNKIKIDIPVWHTCVSTAIDWLLLVALCRSSRSRFAINRIDSRLKRNLDRIWSSLKSFISILCLYTLSFLPANKLPNNNKFAILILMLS